jgi:hypothetical protein
MGLSIESHSFLIGIHNLNGEVYSFHPFPHFVVILCQVFPIHRGDMDYLFVSGYRLLGRRGMNVDFTLFKEHANTTIKTIHGSQTRCVNIFS